MLGTVGGQLHDVARHVSRRLLGLHENFRPLVSAGQLVHQLPGLGLPHQLGLGLQPDVQPVLGDQRVRIGVVGGHRRGQQLGDGLGASALGQLCRHDVLDSDELSLQQLPQPPGDALSQLTGRLLGEGDPEDLIGPDEPIGHQPHHPISHRGGLPGPGTGHHEHRVQLRLNHRLLLRGRILALLGRNVTLQGVDDVPGSVASVHGSAGGWGGRNTHG